MAAYVLDTHVWLWLLLAPEKISPKARKVLNTVGPDDRLMVSAMSIVEIATLVRKGRLELLPSVRDWCGKALQLYAFEVSPVSYDITVSTADLALEHYDSADRVIAATAIAEGATLITADRVLQRCGEVRTLW